MGGEESEITRADQILDLAKKVIKCRENKQEFDLKDYPKEMQEIILEIANKLKPFTIYKPHDVVDSGNEKWERREELREYVKQTIIAFLQWTGEKNRISRNLVSKDDKKALLSETYKNTGISLENYLNSSMGVVEQFLKRDSNFIEVKEDSSLAAGLIRITHKDYPEFNAVILTPGRMWNMHLGLLFSCSQEITDYRKAVITKIEEAAIVPAEVDKLSNVYRYIEFHEKDYIKGKVVVKM